MVSEGHDTERASQHFKQYLKIFPILVSAKNFILSKVNSLSLLAVKSASYLSIVWSKSFRKLIFDVAKPNALLVSNGQNETFLISASDRSIGRDVYVNNAPYDFDKMQKVLSILGNEHSKMLLIDIGANIGTICVPAVKRGLFQKAIAIEPEPLNYSLLSANIHINRLSDKIVAHNFALGQRDNEQLLFELSKDNFGDHRVKIKNETDLYDEANRETITVKSETFDKVIKHIEPKESLIWMDTQGFEGHILFGATNALRLRTPICFEFWPYGLNRSKCYPLLKEALIQGGYNLLHDLNGNQSPVPVTSESFDGLYERLGDRGAYTELLVL